MLTDQALIAWLVMFQHQADCECRMSLPKIVIEGLLARGWVALGDEVDWEGDKTGRLTETGQLIFDLNAADYGLNTIPEESEA